MPDGSIALEENENEDLDLVSLLADQGEADESDNEDDSNGEIPSDPEELKAYALELRDRVSKRNKSLKKAKDAVHRADKEKSEALALYEKLEAKFDSSKQSTQGAADLERQAQEWAEKVELDPTKAIDYADWKQQQLEEKVANYLGSELQTLRAEIASLKGATNPEMLEHKAEVDLLRSNPQFAELPDDALLSLAKGLKKARVRQPRGSVTGQRAAAEKGKPFKLTPEQREAMGF